MTEEKRTAGSRGLSSAAELYDVCDNCDNDERDDQWRQEQQRALLEENAYTQCTARVKV